MEEKVSKPGSTFIAILPFRVSGKQREDQKPPEKLSPVKKYVRVSPFSSVVATFLGVAYVLCFAPFKIKQDKSGFFYIHQRLPQQIMVFIGMVFSVFYRSYEVALEFPEHVNWNPALYFELFHHFVNLAFNLNVWIALWLRKEAFLNIVQYSYQKMTSPTLAILQKRMGYLVAFIAILNTVTLTLCFFFGTGLLATSRWDPYMLAKCFAAHVKSFCVNPVDCRNDSLKDFPLSEMSFWNIISTVFFALSRYLRKVLGISEELFVLVGPITLWVAVHDFVSKVMDESPKNDTMRLKWTEVSKLYKELAEYTDLINRLYGPLMVTYTLTALFYFSINLDEFLTATHDHLNKFKFLLYYVLIVSTFIMSAETSRKMGRMGPWISKHLHDSLSEMSQQELTLILHDISSCRIGVSACGLFTLTYSVVAQMSGVIVTYFIITVQYREQK